MDISPPLNLCPKPFYPRFSAESVETEEHYDMTEKSVPFSPVHEDTTMRKCNGQKGKDSDNVDNKSPQAKFSVACLLYLDQKVSSLSSKLGRT